nr:Transposon Tn7 transposition protein TnsB [Paraburkholderia busanensis]
MTTLGRGMVLQTLPSEKEPATQIRVLVPSLNGLTWMIPVAFGKFSGYARGPFCMPIDLVDERISGGLLIESKFNPPPHWALSDAELNALFGAVATEPCRMVSARDKAWRILEPYVTANPVEQAIRTQSYRSWVLTEANRVAGDGKDRHSVSWLYDVLHRFWASGGDTQSLLGDTAYCGGAGANRIQKIKLGRPDAISRMTNGPVQSIHLTAEDIAKLQVGWEHFRYGRSQHEAYLQTMEAFWRKDEVLKENVVQPILMPAALRPSERQFRYWGRKVERMNSRRRFDGREAMPGSAVEDILLVGQRGWLDATSGDVYLVSVKSRLVVVGCATCYEVMDARTEVISGLHITFEPPSARVALLSVAQAALPKIAWGSRYGFPTLTEDVMPSLRFTDVFTDNGEFRNVLTKRIYVEGWGGWIEYAPAGAGSAKGTIEGDHHARHAEVDHKLPGTTYGKERRPGETDPAAKAALNYYEYVRHHIRRVIRHNTEVAVPHLVTAEMYDDVGPTASRMDVFRWLVEHGYTASPACAPEKIYAHMLPEYPASMTHRGVFLHRSDRGHKVEYVKGCRFVNQYLVDSGLLGSARHHVKNVTLRMDPTDVSVAWLPTKDGLQRLENVDPDRLMRERAPLQDLTVVQDINNFVLLHNRTEEDQNSSDFINARDSESDNSIAAKNKEMTEHESSTGKPFKKNSARKHIGEAREREKAELEAEQSIELLKTGTYNPEKIGTDCPSTGVSPCSHESNLRPTYPPTYRFADVTKALQDFKAKTKDGNKT